MPCFNDAVPESVYWYALGEKLRIKKSSLDRISREFHVYGEARMKIEMFDEWWRSDLDASWDKLVQALKKMGEIRAAKDIEEKYCFALSGICDVHCVISYIGVHCTFVLYVITGR